MAQITKVRKSRKDFPLTERSDGRFQKKVAGKTYYFAGTRQEALDQWLRVKDDLYAGHDPRERTTSLTLGELFNRFLTAKQHAVDSGELTQRSWNDYKSICDEIKDCLELTRTVESLNADDFAKLRRCLGRGRGLVTLKNHIARAKVVFKYAEDHDLIDKRIRGLATFKKPSKSDLRKEQNRRRAEDGARMFTPAEIHQLLEQATSVQLRAMILLAANTGMGNTDVARLQPCHIQGEWLEYPRPKTGIPRRAKLWCETLDALAESGLPFRTKYGAPWVDENSSNNAISKEMAKLMRSLGLHNNGRSFYALRHGFETVAGECNDQPAVDLVMGHGDDSMASVYREGISDERLEAIAQHVHAWLFGRPSHGR